MADATGGRSATAPEGDGARNDDARNDGAGNDGGPRPRVLADTRALSAALGEPLERGAVWRLEETERHLDANVIALPPGERIDDHVGPEEDVLLHVIAGSGVLRSDAAELVLAAGAIVWLPRRARREITAAADGLRYLSVHRRKPGLQVGRRGS